MNRAGSGLQRKLYDEKRDVSDFRGGGYRPLFPVMVQCTDGTSPLLNIQIENKLRTFP